MTFSAPTPEIADALARHGLRPRGLELISPLGELKGRRLAYRLETDDGRMVKVRQFESEEAARVVFELRAGLEEAFAPALARYGAVVVEAWVDGAPLSPRDEGGRVEEAGALLGRLHGRCPAATPPVGTGAWRAGAESDLAILAAAGCLSSVQVERLRAQVRGQDPRTAPRALVHMDFCGENMLVDRLGRLRVIDNEQLSIEPAGLDLARTRDRWPMTADAWARFCRGYRSSSPCEPGAAGFWMVVAALLGARVLLTRSPERLRASLGRLARFALGEGLEEAAPHD